MEDSKFTASLFKVVFTPDNRTIHFDINGVSSIDNKNVTAHITLFAYGYKAIEMDVDPCKTELKGFCPMAPGIIDLISNFPEVGDDLIDGIPGEYGCWSFHHIVYCILTYWPQALHSRYKI